MNLSRLPYICASCSRSIKSSVVFKTVPSQTGQLSRCASFSTSTFSREQDLASTASTDPTSTSQLLPRWKQTPPGMRQPLRLRPQPRQPLWKVNTEQEPLDQMYDRFLGRVLGAATPGREALPEDVKWLAVTHKSFEHGAQGFNDKLAFLGKRIVDLQTTLALQRLPLSSSSSSSSALSSTLSTSSSSSSHPALEGAENMTLAARHRVLDRVRLADVAARYGVQGVMRWKPKKSDNLLGSGIQTIAAHTIYSIIGALAMHRGGEVAATVTRERILYPLGLR